MRSEANLMRVITCCWICTEQILQHISFNMLSSGSVAAHHPHCGMGWDGMGVGGGVGGWGAGLPASISWASVLSNCCYGTHAQLFTGGFKQVKTDSVSVTELFILSKMT